MSGTTPISDPAGAAYADMVFDRNDTLYIAYQDKSRAPSKVRVKKFDSTNWVNVGDPLLATTGPALVRQWTFILHSTYSTGPMFLFTYLSGTSPYNC